MYMILLLIFGVIVVVAIGLVIFLIVVYNALSVAKQKIKEAFSDIDTQLKRRYDLIPNLVETVKGYAKHEKGVFENVTKYRAATANASGVQEKAEASNMLSDALKNLFAVSENYPELKANQNFMELQSSLEEIEDHIQKSRRYYNGSVREFNNKVVVFPNNFVASIFGFKEEEYFEVEDSERENVKVSFNDVEQK